MNILLAEKTHTGELESLGSIEAEQMPARHDRVVLEIDGVPVRFVVLYIEHQPWSVLGVMPEGQALNRVVVCKRENSN